MVRKRDTLAVEVKPDALGPVKEDPPWRDAYEHAIYFLAGHYAAEEIRRQQQYARNRGHDLTAEEIAKVFLKATEYMTAQIQHTSHTDGIKPCPKCRDGRWVYDQKLYGWVPCDACRAPARKEGEPFSPA